MSDTPPVRLRWEGDSFVPISSMQQKRCDEWFVIGEVYDLETVEARSAKSHRHYFAVLREIWKNLPHDIEGLYPSEEHLRKRGLIETGYYNLRTFACESEAGALQLKKFLIHDHFTEFDVISVKGNILSQYRAKSQRVRGPGAMNKEEFQKSKDDVLNWAAKIINVRVKEVERCLK